MTDTKKAKAPDTGRELDRLAQPLARALGNIRSTLAGWDEPAIWNALAAIDKCSPLDPDDPDLCGAERILREALDRVNAERIARNAPWLAIGIRCDNGRWTLSAWHDQGDAMRREFASFAEAKAAGETLQAFLTLVGRDAGFSCQTPPKADRSPDFCDSDIPF
jgi:hypothetical protein